MCVNLLLNTASPIPRVVLFSEGKVLADYSGTDIERTEQLLDRLEILLNEHNCTMKGIQNFTYINGPGSFTGLRIGIAIVQMWHFVTGKSVYTLSNDDFLSKITSDKESCIIISAGVDSVFIKTPGKELAKAPLRELHTAIAPFQQLIVDAPTSYIAAWKEKLGGKNIIRSHEAKLGPLLAGKSYLGKADSKLLPEYFAEPRITSKKS